MNVATYGRGGRFAMTDRGSDALRRGRDFLTIGPSSMYWNGEELQIEIDEVSSPPLVSRMKGRITVRPIALTAAEVALDPEGEHIWRPFAPAARIEVDLGRRGRWSGHGYFDANFGTGPLERDFSAWSWGRFPTQDGATCFYEAVPRHGAPLSIGLDFAKDGAVSEIERPPRARLRRSLWGVARETRADQGYLPRQVKGMLDAPFYCRSVVRTQIKGQEVTGVHETIDLDRFAKGWLMPMIAMRVPRRRSWNF
ncbi:carotenoid 1,2-hydratase [Palleronia aestuarii]|uniref:Carotenoid 1,2-hydratase n=2 Tax=Palleronia aestuarii TaxID=568105 RepID=A0A2W7NE88_9RHOB|nr:carotenoid 1,2-hydratase [Palleronia aestuarii]PZX11426.1 carotenoid 1,2-hydratase [Palleronia aestuarii]